MNKETDMKTHPRPWHLWLMALALASALGCGQADPGSGDELEKTKAPLDDAMVCPDGQVPWRFPASGAATNSEEYLASAEVSMDNQGGLPGYADIGISSVSCTRASIFCLNFESFYIFVQYNIIRN